MSAITCMIASAEIEGVIQRALRQDVAQLRLHSDPTEAEIAAYVELRWSIYAEAVDDALQRIEAELAAPSDDVQGRRTRGRPN